MKFLTHWGMEKNPFEKDIRPSSLTETSDLKQAVGGLNFAFQTGGVALLTGKSGYGKTTILRSFLDGLPPGLFVRYYLKLSTVKVNEFYKMLARALGMEECRTKTENFENIQNKLKSLRKDEKKMPIVILDEAQYLGKDILIELPILMNFDMDSKEYAVLILCGLPSLNPKLSMEQYESLSDRLVFNYDISGMNFDEVKQYVHDRMTEAGVHREIFEESALHAAHSLSKNSIRRLNHILVTSLMVGCTDGLQMVNAETVRKAVQEIKLGEVT